MKFYAKIFFLTCFFLLSAQIYSQDAVVDSDSGSDKTAVVDNNFNDVPENLNNKEEVPSAPVKEGVSEKPVQPVKNTADKQPVKKPVLPVSQQKTVLLDINDSDLLDGRIPGYVKTEKKQSVIEKKPEISAPMDAGKQIEKNDKDPAEKPDYRAFGILIIIVVFIFVLYFMKSKKRRRRVFSTRR